MQKQVTVAALRQVLCDLSTKITDYLEHKSQDGSGDEGPMQVPQLFNILFDRFDTTLETAEPVDKHGKKDKGKERISATVEL